MTENSNVETGLFTVGVFQDVSWAERGLDALIKEHAFPMESITVLAADKPENAGLIERTLGAPGDTYTVRSIGQLLGRGPLVSALQPDMTKEGLGASMRRVGFQPHDGHIFEALLGRGGVLVAVRSEPRAADALAVLHAYGGGNAAIGAWSGRV